VVEDPAAAATEAPVLPGCSPLPDAPWSGAHPLPYMVFRSPIETMHATLELQRTRLDVEVRGRLASVTVTQTYRNAGEHDVEAIYVVPARPETMVEEARLETGSRVVRSSLAPHGEVLAAWQRAKELARAAPFFASGEAVELELFSGAVQPGDLVRTEVRWTTELDGRGPSTRLAFSPPAIPRAARESADPDDRGPIERWLEAGSGSAAAGGEEIAASFTLDPDLPVACVSAQGHDVEISAGEPVRVETSGGAEAARSGLGVTWGADAACTRSGGRTEGEDGGGWFAATVLAAAADAERPPREWILVVDRTMPEHFAEAAVAAAVELAVEDDRLDMVQFAGKPEVLWEESRPAREDTRAELVAAYERRVIAPQAPALAPALRAALELPDAGDLRRHLLVITDGGVEDRIDCLEIAAQASAGATITAVGTYESSYRPFLERLSIGGGIAPVVVGSTDRAADAIAAIERSLAPAAMTDVRVRVRGAEVVDLLPARVDALHAGTPLRIAGRTRGALAAEVVLEGMDGGRARTIEVPLRSVDDGSARRAWERARLATHVWSRRPASEVEKDAALTEIALSHGAYPLHTAHAVASADSRMADARRWFAMFPLPLDDLLDGTLMPVLAGPGGGPGSW
jgi:Ca-activated chloride channel family protein